MKGHLLSQQGKTRPINDIIGDSNQAEININGISTKVLLDTGSQISSVSESFYRKYLQSTTPLENLDEIINIECADGNKLPYLGIIACSFTVPGIKGIDQHDGIFLVTPDTEFSSKVPVLIGTNILQQLMSSCKSKHGSRFLQVADLYTPWYLVFRSMSVRDRELKRKNNRIGLVKCAENQTIILKPNMTATVKCYIEQEMDYYPTCVTVDSSELSSLSPDIDITPIMTSFVPKRNNTIDVHLSNVTMRTVSISPKSIIGEIQPVTIEDMTSQMTADSHNILDDIEIESGDLTSEQMHQLKEVLKKHEDIFSKSDEDIGHFTGVKHEIHLNDDRPFKQRYRRIPPSMVDEVRQHIEQLLAAGIIRRSYSSYASNVVLVRKRSGALRMCVDYRFLNARTVKDQYALPRVEDILDAMKGSRYFSVVDMKSGYHQIEVAEHHKDRTAFTVGPLGFWEFNRLPFGLCNSPSTYQRVMEQCLGDLNMKICCIFLDDLIIFADTFEEHLQRLEIVFNRLRECNLKLAPKKCSFMQKKVKYVGYIVSEDGVECDPDKIDKVRNWPTPKCPEDVRQFVGFAGFYRKFVKNFSQIVKPLYEVMPVQNQKRSKKTKSSNDFIWGTAQEQAFQELKNRLTTAPVLAYPEYTIPFSIYTDACGQGIGAVLCQTQEGQERVISYASRSLTKSEKNYPTHKLEFLALKWAVVDKFADYLLGNKFTVITDNNPLTYVLTSAKLDATGHRWVQALSLYDFNIVYKPGKQNKADPLSRLSQHSSELEEISSDTVKVTCCTRSQETASIEAIALDANIDLMDATDVGLPTSQIDVRELRKAQREDTVLSVWIRCVRDKTVPNRKLIITDRRHGMLSKMRNSLKLIRGVLYREVVDKEVKKQQLVLPEKFVAEALMGCHDNVGHPGRERTLAILKDRFYWPGMNTTVENWVKGCERCVKRKSSTQIKAPLVGITSSYPLELVCMDFLKLEPAKGGIVNVLVITDHYTRFAQAFPTKNQTALTTAEVFFNNFVLKYGFPTRLHTDQGSNFESALMKELCKLTGITKSRTTIYNPKCNGMTERFNKTLIGMLGTLENTQKINWKQYVEPLVYAYNATPHESTGISPFELMFGRKAKLPVDLQFSADPVIERQDQIEYVEQLKERLRLVYEIADRAANKAREKQKVQYDKKARAGDLQIGDKVLVKVLKFDGPHKLKDKFEEELYEVVRKPNAEIPVFVVRSPDGKEKLLNRNHLLPVESNYRGRNIVPASGNRDDSEENLLPNMETEEHPQSDVVDAEEDVESEFERYIPDVYHNNIDGDAHNADEFGRETSEVDENEEMERRHDSEVDEADGASRGEDDNAEEVIDRVDDSGGDTEVDQEIVETDSEVSSVEQNEVEEEVRSSPRRSRRERKPPDWFKDYMMRIAAVKPLKEFAMFL